MFDWDDANRAHIRRHGVEPHEAEAAIRDRWHVPFATKSERGEPRWGIIGTTEADRLLAVVYTRRGDRIRVVTAWPAGGRYARVYREANQ